MEFSDRRGLKNAAKESLSSASYDPKKIILIHTGAVLLLSLVLTVINIILQQQIEGTGGLSGLGTRSVLSTIQSLLQLAQAILLPFWNMGLITAAIKISRNQRAEPDTLLAGFRRFGPVLRCQLLKGLIIAGVMIGACYAATLLFLLTPLANPLMEALEPMLRADASMDPMLVLDSIDPATMIPLYAIVALLCCLLVLPVAYRYRMADYILMDGARRGALHALGISRIMLRGHRVTLFKLDLSFWWYYLLEALALAVGYGDLILPMLGIRLPVSGTAAAFLFFLLYLLCTLAIQYFARDRVAVTYAKAYDALLQTMPPQPMPNQRSRGWNQQ